MASRVLKSIPSWLIIILCCCAGVLFAFLFSLESIFPNRSEPTSLPALPSSGVSIYGIETGYFFQADPHIQTSDHRIFRLTWQHGTNLWQPINSPSEIRNGDPCTHANIVLIEVASDPIIECQVVRTIGEWCPGTTVSIAITKTGEVWRLVEKPPCLYFFFSLLTFFIPAGFILGVIIVFLKKIFIPSAKFTDY
jgi:hypothetical protein